MSEKVYDTIEQANDKAETLSQNIDAIVIVKQELGGFFSVILECENDTTKPVRRFYGGFPVI